MGSADLNAFIYSNYFYLCSQNCLNKIKLFVRFLGKYNSTDWGRFGQFVYVWNIVLIFFILVYEILFFGTFHYNTTWYQSYFITKLVILNRTAYCYISIFYLDQTAHMQFIIKIRVNWLQLLLSLIIVSCQKWIFGKVHKNTSCV